MGFLAVADSKITSQITIEKGFMQSIWLKEYTGQERFGNSIKLRWCHGLLILGGSYTSQQQV